MHYSTLTGFEQISRGQKRHQVFVAGNIKCGRRPIYATKALLREIAKVFFSLNTLLFQG